MRTTPRTFKAKALLRAERQRVRRAAGPKGSPLYDANQKGFVKDPKHKRVKNAPGVPAVKKPAGRPSPSPLYDANQTDLTEPKKLHGKRQEKLKGAKMGVIDRIRRNAAAPSSDMIDMRAQKDLDKVVNQFVGKLKAELSDLKRKGTKPAHIKAILLKRYPFINESLFKKMGL